MIALCIVVFLMGAFSFGGVLIYILSRVFSQICPSSTIEYRDTGKKTRLKV
jgi:hypothetical protein